MKVGMTLEGGGMRGMYTAGVLDTFLEAGITVDAMVGVSAGALFGVNFLSRQSGRVIRYNKRFNADPNYMGLRPLLREGNIVSTLYAYQAVPYTLDPFGLCPDGRAPGLWIAAFCLPTGYHRGKAVPGRGNFRQHSLPVDGIPGL